MLRRSSHSVWDCQYHLVWATKRRRRALEQEHERSYCKDLLRRAAEEYGMYVEALEVDVDHVHVYVGIPPQLSVGRAVGILKSVSARLMFKRFSYLRRTFWSGEMWTDGYFVRSVGEGVTADTVRRYIESHEDKSAVASVQAELFPKRVRAAKGKPER